MATTIPAARAALLERLRTVFGPQITNQSVEVAYGQTSFYALPQVVTVAGWGDADEEWAALGALRRNETYEIEVQVEVTDLDASPDAEGAQKIEEAYAALHDGVRTAVHGAAPPLALGSVLRAELRRSVSQGPVPLDPGGWQVFSQMFIAVLARIEGA